LAKGEQSHCSTETFGIGYIHARKHAQWVRFIRDANSWVYPRGETRGIHDIFFWYFWYFLVFMYFMAFFGICGFFFEFFGIYGIFLVFFWYFSGIFWYLWYFLAFIVIFI
jgi:hypothetical protein